MHKFTTGLVTGGVIAVMGVYWVMSDDKTRRRVVKDSKKRLRKAGSFFDGMSDMFQ